jgi:hypothetical protein
MGFAIVKAFQRRLETLRYQRVGQNTTISIGLCDVGSDCHFTNRELFNFAESAKNFAKKNDRNCVATFSDARYKEPYVLDSSARSAK